MNSNWVGNCWINCHTQSKNNNNKGDCKVKYTLILEIIIIYGMSHGYLTNVIIFVLFKSIDVRGAIKIF